MPSNGHILGVEADVEAQICAASSAPRHKLANFASLRNPSQRRQSPHFPLLSLLVFGLAAQSCVQEATSELSQEQASERQLQHQAARQLRFAPQVLAFGDVAVNSERILQLEVYNPSNQELRLLIPRRPGWVACDEGFSTDGFCIEGLDERRELWLKAKQRRSLLVKYRPQSFGRFDEALIFSACEAEDCQRGVMVQARSDSFHGIQCQPEQVDFGSVGPGQCRQAILQCINSGLVATKLLSVRSQGDSFSTSPLVPTVIAAEEKFSLQARFCGQAPTGRREGVLVFEAEYQGFGVRNGGIDLRGQVCEGSLKIEPQALDFAETSLISSKRQSITLKNLSDRGLNIKQISIRGSEFFQVVGDEMRHLEPKQSLQIEVEFLPGISGEHRAQLLLETSDDCLGTIEIPLEGTGVNYAPCSYTIEPSSLNFGLVAPGLKHKRNIYLNNTGTDICLYDWQTPSADAAFQLNSPRSGRLLPGESKAFELEFSYPASASGLERSLDLRLGMNSIFSPRKQILFQARVDSLSAELSPQQLDFGALSSRCRLPVKKLYFHRSPHRIDEVIENIQVVGSGFTLARRFSELPLKAPEEFVIPVRPVATLRGRHRAELVVQTNYGIYRSAIVSDGFVAADSYQEDFSVGSKQAVDLLIAVDPEALRSSSFGQMARATQTIMRRAWELGIDLQVGVLNNAKGHDGALMQAHGVGGPLVSVNDPQSGPTLAALIEELASADTSGGYSGLTKALSAPKLLTHNLGFLRKDAALAVLWLADGRAQPQYSVAGLRNYLARRMGVAEHGVRLAASYFEEPMGHCPSHGPETVLSTYRELVDWYSAGFFPDCVSNWELRMNGLVDYLLEPQRILSLAHPAVPQTIEVFQDGIRVPNLSEGRGFGFRYDSHRRQIHLEGIASHAVAVNVRYTQDTCAQEF